MPVPYIGDTVARFADVGPSSQRFPFEYLCDGGDRDVPVHYDDIQRRGLNTEDTIAEYYDHLGTFHRKPSNRVCVYAPRFAALRTVYVPSAGITVDRPASSLETKYEAGLRSHLASSHEVQRDRLGGIRMRSRASSFDSEEAQSAVDQTTRLASHTKLINLYQELAFFESGL